MGDAGRGIFCRPVLVLAPFAMRRGAPGLRCCCVGKDSMPTGSVPVPLPPASLQLRNTTLFLVRHADVPAGTNPHLNAAGQTRGNELIRVLGGAGIAGIYASEMIRTQETAQPLAAHLGLVVKVIDAADSAAVVQDVRARHAGQSVLIVGHSNTIPEIVSQCGGPPVSPIAPTEFDRLFVVTMTQLRTATVQAAPLVVSVPERRICTVLPLKYGAMN